MDSFIYSINATVPIFLIMILGYVLKKKKMLNDGFLEAANKFVYTVGLPVMVFTDLAFENFKEVFDIKFVLYCMIITIVSFFVVWFLAESFLKDKGMIGSFVQGSFRSSAAVLGLAFIHSIYSSAGMGPLMILSAVPLYNIFSVMILTLKGDGNNKDKTIKKAFINVLKNPIIIGIALGLIGSLIEIKIPVIGVKTLNSLSNMTTPLALLCVGAGFDGRAAFAKIKPTIAATFIKLIALPAIGLPIAVALGFRNQELMAIIIMLASPATISGYIMAKNTNNDAVLSSGIIVLSTVLSSLTLTLIIYLMRSLSFI
ncbi:MAG: AEC family transporter [Lachnospiraceae bacterium]|nr:AEC family transporter [Lachnospira sp.]MBR6697594.1 AEC family transporter [Lachnospiraceae bacterium]